MWKRLFCIVAMLPHITISTTGAEDESEWDAMRERLVDIIIDNGTAAP